MANVLGLIDCPHCGESMKVKTDKNGAPFGHCEHCSGQLRVGGSERRVETFYRKNPHLKPQEVRQVQEPPKQEAKPAPKPAPKTATKQKSGFSFFENALNQVAP